MALERLTRPIAYAWVVLLALVMVGPALWPGFALSYDLVFTPRQDLLAGSIGLGGGLPRAVPQDAIVALATMIVPGALVEKAVLLAIPIIVGTGMLALLRTTAAGVVAATFAIVNPFVAQRLVIGHWGFLLAYALIPWALVIARRLRREGQSWDGLRLLLVVAAGSLTPSGSLLIAAVAVPVALLPGSAYPIGKRLALVAAVCATWLPWLLPALIHPLGVAADPDGTRVFALRSDAPGGIWLTALTGGGIWNADVVAASRGTALTWVLAIAVIGLAAAGAHRLISTQGRAVIGWWGSVAVLGLVAALASSVAPGAWASVVDAVPGAGLARDAHKLLAPSVLLLAAAAGEGARRLAGSAPDRAARALIVVALAIVPLATQPDALVGVGGRLAAVEYPDDWGVVRHTLQEDTRTGDVASFPWTAFRRFDWNQGRTVLDPAPRWMPRPTVVADNLLVATPDGPADVAGDDPRAAAVATALAAQRPMVEVLPRLGVGWVLLAKGTPGPVPDLEGWEVVVEGEDLALYAAPVPVEGPPTPDGLVLVALVDAALLIGLLAGLAALGFRRVRVRGPSRLVP